MNKELKKIIKQIKKAKSIALFTHTSPDFDAFGSTYAFYFAVKSLGKVPVLFAKEDLTEKQLMILDENILSKEDCFPEKFDLFIAFDSSSNDRLGEYGPAFDAAKNSILIDHHKSLGWKAKFNYINETRSSCAELVYEVLTALKIIITPQIASLLYLGLSSDTKSFVNSNTNQNSFKVAMDLLSYGADIKRINEMLYQNRTFKSIEFNKFLLNNFKVKKDCAYCLVTRNDLNDLKGEKSDCDGYSSSLIAIRGINYSFSLIETENGIYRVSFRSKSGYDVFSKAVKLGGGGHLCAAGATIIAKNINEAKNIVLKAVFED